MVALNLCLLGVSIATEPKPQPAPPITKPADSGETVTFSPTPYPPTSTVFKIAMILSLPAVFAGGDCCLVCTPRWADNGYRDQHDLRVSALVSNRRMDRSTERTGRTATVRPSARHPSRFRSNPCGLFAAALPLRIEANMALWNSRIQVLPLGICSLVRKLSRPLFLGRVARKAPVRFCLTRPTL